MNDSDQPTLDLPELPEELVAYLDGELRPDEAAAVEARLAEDEKFRRQMQQAQQAWDLLDNLPRVEVGEDFTRTTVEMAALAASQELEQQQVRGPRQWLEWSFIVGGLLVSVSLGYFVVAGLLILPAAERDDSQPIAALESEQQAFIDWLATLSTTEREQLVRLSASDQIQQFQIRGRRDEIYHWIENLNEDEQSELLALLNDKRSGQLKEQRADREFQEWSDSLSPDERSQLAKLTTAEQQQKFQQAKQDSQLQRFRRLSNFQVAPEDLRTIFSWLDRYALAHQQEILERIPKEYRSRLSEVKDMTLRQRLSMLALLRDRQQLPTPEPAELAELQSSLSPSTQRILELVPAGQARMELAMRWLQAAVVARMSRGVAKRGPMLGKEELQRFMGSLDPETKRRLQKLDDDERERELRRLLFERRKQNLRDAGPPVRPYPRSGPGSRPRFPASDSERPER